jgi:hypothetical protein
MPSQPLDYGSSSSPPERRAWVIVAVIVMCLFVLGGPMVLFMSSRTRHSPPVLPAGRDPSVPLPPTGRH